MKLSVIIPVYNAEAYLEKCVKSVMAFPCDKEVILVDDGSRDRSGEICDRLAISDEGLGINVIHQENKGVSAARNAGLDIATGDYVWFVDADDIVLSEQLQVNSEKLEINPQLIVFGFVWEENGVAKSFGASEDEIPYNLWRCWFNRNAIEKTKLRFTAGRKYAEDQEFILKFIVGCDRCNVEAINKPLYYYTLRPGSAMTKKGVKLKRIKDVAAVLLQFIGLALIKGKLNERWAWMEIKRMSKSLYVTIIR